MSFFQFSKKNPKFFLQRRQSFFSAHPLCPSPPVFNSNHCHQKSTSSMFSSGHFHQIFLSAFVVPLSTIVMHHNSSLQFLRSHLILCYQRPVFLFLFQLSCCFQPLLMKIACFAQLKITICRKQPLLSTSAFFLPASIFFNKFVLFVLFQLVFSKLCCWTLSPAKVLIFDSLCFCASRCLHLFQQVNQTWFQHNFPRFLIKFFDKGSSRHQVSLHYWSSEYVFSCISSSIHYLL